MAGIIPNLTDGGVVIRDSSGVCTPVIGVSNYFCPGPDFTTTCEVSYLPNDCTARITADQINAFQSEVLAFAEVLNPQGFWNCGSVTNLATIFGEWSTGAHEGSMLDLMQMHLCSAPVITQSSLQEKPFASFIMCNGDGSIVRYVERPYVTPGQVVSAICGDDDAKTDLALCMAEETATAICGTPAAVATLAACLPSTPIDPAAIVAAILADNTALCALLNGILHNDPRNSIVVAVDVNGKCGITENDAVTVW